MGGAFGQMWLSSERYVSIAFHTRGRDTHHGKGAVPNSRHEANVTGIPELPKIAPALGAEKISGRILLVFCLYFVQKSPALRADKVFVMFV